MKKKKHHHRAAKRPPRPRNASTGFATSAPRPRAKTASQTVNRPNWKTILAAVAGGAGSAALGGLVVNQQILSPEAAGLGLMLGGGATAYFSDGMPRIVGTSVAASGAGQFALAIMNKRAVKAHEDANATKTRPATASAPAPAQLPPPPAVAPRQRAGGGGVVLDMFQNAAQDVDSIEDEWRYGIRDEAVPGNEPLVIDLDEAA
ncbi:MAG: hypothetical protein JNL83_00530 [Myxococcales bacterium]|nr:hypothetical protein [Myxococcales bacterium]